MSFTNSKFKWFISLLLLFLFLSSGWHTAEADVTEVETEQITINKTEVTDGKSGDPMGDEGEPPWWKKALNKIGEIKDSTIDGLKDFGKWVEDGVNDFTDWAGDKWNIVADWVGNAWNTAADWLAENKWAQSIIAGIIAAVVIIGGIAALAALGVVGAITIGVVLVVATGALIGAFVYQWIAGDSYSFWGALGSAGLGGIIGYVGLTTGAFASAIGWLRNTAGPATWNWMRNTAWPWVLGKGRAAWIWMRTVAWPWLRGKGVAALNGIKNFLLSYKSRFIGTYTGSNGLRNLLFGPALGFAGGLTSAFTSFLLTGELKAGDFLVDILFGGISGLILGPFVLVGQLKWVTVAGLSLYGGIEGYIADGIKAGEWDSMLNFILGAGVSFISMKGLSIVFESIFKNEIASELATKATEETIKTKTKDFLSNESQGDGTKENKQEIKTEEPQEGSTDGTEESKQENNTEKDQEESSDVKENQLECQQEESSDVTNENKESSKKPQENKSTSNSDRTNQNRSLRPELNVN